MPKHSNVYYIRNSTDGTYTPCKNAVSVRNEINADLFHNKGNIYEGSTGVLVCDASKLNEVLSSYKGREKSFKETVQEFADKYGLSPRYTQPEIKKSELFPRNDNRKLMPTLYHKEKCWFTRFPNEYGLDLYQMDKEKSVYQTLYAPCNNWMIGLGPSYSLEKIVEIMNHPDFNLYENLKSQFENDLENPQKWADISVAEFLGRIDEANAHNQPIREMRAAENKELEAQREAARIEREEREAAEYISAISSAEQAILDKGTISNKEINGKDLLLQLFRENDIDLPLKTQGWVKSSLAAIYHDSDYGWNYRYYGRESTVIEGYINKLAAAVEAKHQRSENEQTKSKPSILGELAENKSAVASRQSEDNPRRDKKAQTEL